MKYLWPILIVLLLMVHIQQRSRHQGEIRQWEQEYLQQRLLTRQAITEVSKAKSLLCDSIALNKECRELAIHFIMERDECRETFRSYQSNIETYTYLYPKHLKP